MAGVRRCILVECGAAETRAAFILGDEIIGFWFGPARGDEGLPRRPQTGEIHFGRIRSVSKALGGAFVDIGAASDGFLPFSKGGPVPVEGAALIVRVRRPPIGAKGALVTADWKSESDEAAAALEARAAETSSPGRIGEFTDAAVMAVTAADGSFRANADITVNDPDAAKALGKYSPRVRVEECPFEKACVGEALEAALERTVPLAGGGRLVIDETEAMTVIDVDSGAAAEGGGARLNDKVNERAAEALFGALARRGIGGRIGVDFLPPSGAPSRQALLETLKTAREGRYDARIGKLSADGLFDMTAPRRRLSLLEEVSEPAGAWLRTGRRLTLDWQGKAAIGALERLLRARPAARPRLIVSSDLGAYLGDARSQWTARLDARFGARFSIIPDDTFEGRSFDLAE